LKDTYRDRLLVVSNSAGSSDDVDHRQERMLEEAIGVKVLRHSIKKPGCHKEVADYLYGLRSQTVRSPLQVAVIGDRLMTDVAMGNLMGAWTVWVKTGVVENHGTLSRFEKGVASTLAGLGVESALPR